jgi:hypothetical protein
MLIGRDYLLEKPPGPSAPKRFFDQRVVPLAVNMASSLEFALDDAARRTGLRPVVILSATTVTAALLVWRLVRSRELVPRIRFSRTLILAANSARPS